MPRVVLLVTSPRMPAGLLTAPAWDLVRTVPVLAEHDSELTTALRAQRASVTLVPATAAAVLSSLDGRDCVVWLAGPGGDEALGRELGLRLAREPGLAELELMYGSWDPPGARLLDVVAVMDRLASPGGDPWKRQQTHQSLARYLLEEAYEAYDAIEAHDLDALREEMGDVLLQVVLHARMAEEADRPWSVDDLAGDLVDKMVRRNPHVFGDTPTTDIDEITRTWERVKQEEKARESAMDGIALGQPALALATKILSRARRAGVAVPPSSAVASSAALSSAASSSGSASPASSAAESASPASAAESASALVSALASALVGREAVVDEDTLGEVLLALVAAAEEAGWDAEAALRRVALARAEAVRAAERRDRLG